MKPREIKILADLERLYPQLKTSELLTLAPLLTKRIDYKINPKCVESTEFLPLCLSNYLLEGTRPYKPDFEFSIDYRYSRN